MTQWNGTSSQASKNRNYVTMNHLRSALVTSPPGPYMTIIKSFNWCVLACPFYRFWSLGGGIMSMLGLKVVLKRHFSQEELGI